MATNLTMTGAAYGTGKFGSGLTGGFGTLPIAALNSLIPMTAEVWASTSAATSGNAIAFGSPYLWMGMDTSGKPAFGAMGCYGSRASGAGQTWTGGTTALTDGAMHHYAVVIDGSGNSKFFIDGVQVASGVQTGSFANTAQLMAVRNYSDGSNAPSAWQGTVDEAAIFSGQRYTATFTPATSAYTGSETGLLNLYHLESSGLDSAGATIIAASNSGLIYSPFTWSAGKTVNSGAYVSTLFSGTSLALNFDVSGLGATAPQIVVNIDGQGAQVFSLAGTIVPTMPTATSALTKHHLRLSMKSRVVNQNVWSPQSSAVVLTSLTLAAGATVQAPTALPRRIAWFGDSISEAYINSANADLTGSDATLSPATLVARMLGAELGLVAFSGAALLNAGNGGIPALNSTYASLWSGQARSFTAPAPDLVVIEIGQNDTASNSVFQAGVQSFLAALLAALPAGVPIAWLSPLTGKYAAQIQAGIAAVGSPRVSYIDTTTMFDTTLSFDGAHPQVAATVGTIAPALAARLLPILAGVVNRWTH